MYVSVYGWDEKSWPLNFKLDAIILNKLFQSLVIVPAIIYASPDSLFNQLIYVTCMSFVRPLDHVRNVSLYRIRCIFDNGI